MTTKTWNFTLDGQPHTLTLKHGVLSGKRAIVLDDQLLEQIPGKLFASGSRHEYYVGSHSLVVVIQETAAWFAYDLLVDGVSLTSGAPGPQRVKNPARRGALMLSVIIVCIGCVISWIMKSGYDRQLVFQEWPVVMGTVTGLDTSYHHESNDNGADREYYYPILDVDYVVDDSRHTVRLEDNNRAYDTSSQALAAHSVGENQRLYVNPAQPPEAELYFEKLSPTGWIGTSLGIMGMFSGMAVIILVAVWLQTRERAPGATARVGQISLGGKRAKEARRGDEALLRQENLSEADVHPGDRLLLGEEKNPALSDEEPWAKLPERVQPILHFRQLVGKIALLAFLSIFWIVPALAIMFFRGQENERILLLGFFLFWYVAVGLVTYRIAKGLIQGLRGRRMFLHGQAQATARILRRRVVEHEGNYGTSYSYHLQLEFNPTMAAVSAGSLQLEAQISHKLYQSLLRNEPVEVSYAVEDPHIFILEDE
jgi:hypothetical protein